MSSRNLDPKIYLHRLIIKNFRNITKLELELSPAINLIVGPNGQGKTNILEAMTLSCSLKPLQPLQNVDLIKADQEKAELYASFLGQTGIDLDILIHARGKKAQINGKAIKSSAILAKNIPIVSFIPSELNMITGGGSLRRRALDLACASLFHQHFQALNAYEKILTHRNRLLKEKNINKSSLSIFTKLLIKESSNIIFLRHKTIEKMRPYFEVHLAKILGPEHRASLEYQAEQPFEVLTTPDDIAIMLAQAHQNVEAQEFIRRVTLFGPHLHDISFVINGLCAKKCASRGQSRALVLSFKIAQMMVINDVRESPPILILDDIVSELDQNKQENLLRIIQSLGLQAFFTATSLDYFSGIAKDEAKIFDIDQTRDRQYSNTLG